MLKSKYQQSQTVWFVDSGTKRPHEGKVVRVWAASVEGGEPSYTYSVSVSSAVTKEIEEELIGDEVAEKENFSEAQLYASLEECKLAAKL